MDAGPSAAGRPMRERVMTRFGATLVANLLRAGFSLASGILVARGLGASGYGNMHFLLGTFVAVSQLLEMGTSSAFYTFISQRRRERAFFALYLGWMVFQLVATLLIIGVVLPQAVITSVWVGHGREIVLLAFGTSFLMTQAWGMVGQLGEAMRKTVVVQGAAVLQGVVHLVLVAAAVYGKWLTVQTVMWLLGGEYLVLIAIFGPRLLRGAVAGQVSGRGGHTTIVREFTGYCKPLVIYSWIGCLYVFADRWMLQQFGGAAQQGFFAVGHQFATVSLIATTSVVKIFWKEIAEAHAGHDRQRVRTLYVSVSRGLYLAGAWLSCLLIPYSREILGWILGAGYESAWVCLALMFLYPVHQSMGQINGTFFYATEATRSYTRIGLIMMAVSIPVTYVLLASPGAWISGLGLGAVGLAAKMVVLQIVGVNLQAYVIARRSGWAYEYGYQALILGALVSLGWLSKWAATEGLTLVGLASHPVEVMGLGALTYVSISAGIVYAVPTLIGCSRGEIQRVFRGLGRRPRPVVMANTRV